MKQYRDVAGKVKIRDGLVSDHLAPEVLGGDVERAPNHVNADPRAADYHLHSPRPTTSSASRGASA
jgi:hypothetical protein